jgi:mannose/fructose-specific phosphotransferase system component IIA
MNDSPAPIRGVVVAHGEMAGGLVDAVHHICGLDETDVVPISNRSLAPDALLQRIRDEIRGPTIVFTDMQTGSCGMAARRFCAEELGTPVITGVNLPLLLEFATHRHLPIDELLERLVARGRDGIQLISNPARDAGRTAARR